jgi:CSLREA domain-containing protein
VGPGVGDTVSNFVNFAGFLSESILGCPTLSMVPTLISPANASTIENPTPEFVWGDVRRATEYHIQVDDDSGFDNPIIDTITTLATHTPTSSLADGLYYWHVQSNSIIGWSDFSATWTFTIDHLWDTAIYVTTTDDTIQADGYCSLREAIRAANNNVMINECRAGRSHLTDTILLENGATYLLTILGANEDESLTGDLDILDNPAVSDLHINVNHGGEAIIDASNITDRIFHIMSGASVEIDSVIIRNGNTSTGEYRYGGGIWNLGILNLSDSTISQNSADAGGGVYNSGQLTISVSIISTNIGEVGGGIYNTNIVTIDGSVINSNIAGNGGGILNSSGSFLMSNSTVEGNSGQWGGGGIVNGGIMTINTSVFILNTATSGNGGGIENSSSASSTINQSTFLENSAMYGGGISIGSPLTVTNSTLSGNSASMYGGGIYNASYSAIAINDTFSGNSALVSGGGLYNANELTMLNSTFFDNSAPSGGSIWNYSSANLRLSGTLFSAGVGNTNCLGPIIDNGYNLSDDGSCGFNGAGSQNNATLILGLLLDNGGLTLTHKPGAGSAAVDLIPNGVIITNGSVSYTCNQNGELLDTDQRGYPRPASTGGNCDAGAVEAYDNLYVVNSQRVGVNPTSAASVDFTVTFSEVATGVDISDFTLTTTGITGAYIFSVNSSGTTYTVTVNTGNDIGTIRLDVIDDDSILNSVGNPLGGVGTGNGNYTSGEVYSIFRTLFNYLPFIRH